MIAIVFVVTAMILLIVALVLFVRGRRDAPQGTPLPNGRGIMVLTFAGLILSLASQLPIFP